MKNQPLTSHASAAVLALPRGLSRLALRIHRDEQGNLGVLLMATVLALVLLIAMIWNTAEATTRRAHVQNAADASAHASATWMARTLNLVSATNMLIGENASSEVILRSVQPTTDDVAATLTNETKRWNLRLTGNDPTKGESNIPDLQFFDEVLGTGGSNAKGTQLLATLASISPDLAAVMPSLDPFLSAAERNNINTTITLRIPRNQIALQYVQGVWIDGGAPANANFPPPPQANGGTGLKSILGNWIADLKVRYQVMIDAIPSQWDVWTQFVNQTTPAMGFDLATLAARRATMHEYEQQIVPLTPAAAEEQRDRLATFFKCTITKCQLTPPDPDTGLSQSADIQAPVFEAAIPASMAHSDPLRQEYSDDAIKRFGNDLSAITIDPINVNLDNAALWHPGSFVNTPVLTGGPPHTYRVAGGEWAAIGCAPLARYINDRVGRDQAGLAAILQQLDDIRASVRARIYPIPWVPNPIVNLPNQLILDATHNLPLPPEPLGLLPKPRAAPADVQAQIDTLNAKITQYNQDVKDYIQKVQGMYTNQPNLGLSWIESFAMNCYGEIDGGTNGFAVSNWYSHVDHFRYEVLKALGNNKGFMVLKTYKLDYIPEWAQSGVKDSAYTYVYNDVLNKSYGWIGMSAGFPYAWNSQLGGWGVLWQVYRDLVTDLMASGVPVAQAMAQARQAAPNIARGICATGAVIIANEVSAEWIARPWPYEITPQPDSTAGKSDGWLNVDRIKFYTILTAAAGTDANQMRFSLPNLMGTPPTLGPAQPGQPPPLAHIAAYAQSEAFNWMEYNDSYGGGAQYDAISSYGHGVFGGSPAPWRISTIGGWTWQPRLALTDQLAPAISLNPEMQQIFTGAGILGNDPDSLDKLIMH